MAIVRGNLHDDFAAIFNDVLNRVVYIPRWQRRAHLFAPRFFVGSPKTILKM